MKPTGVNLVAACLCAAKVRVSRPDATVTIKGDDMNQVNYSIEAAFDRFVADIKSIGLVINAEILITPDPNVFRFRATIVKPEVK